jgi:hypothetical protein
MLAIRLSTPTRYRSASVHQGPGYGRWSCPEIPFLFVESWVLEERYRAEITRVTNDCQMLHCARNISASLAIGDLIRWPLADHAGAIELIVDVETFGTGQVAAVEDHAEPIRANTLWVKGEAYPMLTDRRNVVVVADEAHRSQYGFKARIEKTGEMAYGFAKHLRDALARFPGAGCASRLPEGRVRQA